MWIIYQTYFLLGRQSCVKTSCTLRENLPWETLTTWETLTLRDPYHERPLPWVTPWHWPRVREILHHKPASALQGFCGLNPLHFQPLWHFTFEKRHVWDTNWLKFLGHMLDHPQQHTSHIYTVSNFSWGQKKSIGDLLPLTWLHQSLVSWQTHP